MNASERYERECFERALNKVATETDNEDVRDTITAALEDDAVLDATLCEFNDKIRSTQGAVVGAGPLLDLFKFILANQESIAALVALIKQIIDGFKDSPKFVAKKS